MRAFIATLAACMVQASQYSPIEELIQANLNDQQAPSKKKSLEIG